MYLYKLSAILLNIVCIYICNFDVWPILYFVAVSGLKNIIMVDIDWLHYIKLTFVIFITGITLDSDMDSDSIYYPCSGTVLPR